MATSRMATNMDPDPDVDMMDIDDDFSDDELNAFLEAHGLDEGPGPYRRTSSQGRGQQQQQPRSKWDDQQVPPPSAQRQVYPSSERKTTGWKEKGRAVDLDEDYDRPPPSYQKPPRPQPNQLHGGNGRWKGKGKERAYGQGDVLGLDHSAGFEKSAGLNNPAEFRNYPSFGRGDVLGLDGVNNNRKAKVQAWLADAEAEADDEAEAEAVAAHLGTPGRPKRVISPSPEPSLGSSPPVLSGLRIRSKGGTVRQAGLQTATSGMQSVRQRRADTRAKAAAGQRNVEDQPKAAVQGEAQPQAEGGGKVEGAGGDETAEPDPYDSEVSIAARPIVSHDPDHPNRPIDLDVKVARGVVRHVLMTEGFPEEWPAPKTEAEGQTAAEGGAEVSAKQAYGSKVGAGNEKGNVEAKGAKDGVEGAKMGREVTVEEVDGSKELKGKNKVVIPKGVVMLVTSIQYLKMPPDTPSGSEAGSEYGYEGDSQCGSTPASELWSEQPRGPGGEQEEKVDADYGDEYMEADREEDYGMEHDEGPLKGPREEVQEIDLEDNEDSDISMSFFTPSSQVPPPSQQPSLKRTWSQRQDHRPSCPSSRSSPSDLFYPDDDPYHGLPPPPRPPSSSSLPSQPPMGPPNLLIRLQLYDGEFWVQAILRPEFHHLVLGYDFDQWASDTESEPGAAEEEGKKDVGKVGGGVAGKGGNGQNKGKDGKEKTQEQIEKEEEEKEQEMQGKWHKKWVEKARGEVREGSYVRMVGDVVVEFEEVEVEVAPVVKPGVVAGGDKGVHAATSKVEGKRNALWKDISVGPLVPRTKAVQYNYRGGKIYIPDDRVGDPERLEKLRREAMERKWLAKSKEAEPRAQEKDIDKPNQDEKPKTTKMVCLVVGHMVPVGYDRKFIRELKKAELKAMEEELGPVPVASHTTGDEMDLDKKDNKPKKKKEVEKEPEKPKPWWVETGYRAELEKKRRQEEAQRLAKAKERELAQNANPFEYTRPDPNKILPPGWENMTIFEVDALMKEWEKKNKPKEPKPPKPPKPVKKPIITARQAPQFRSSITAQEIFQLQNPDRKPPVKPAGPAYLPLEGRPLQRPQEVRPVAIEVNQVVQRKILELPRRREPRVQQEPGPQPQQQPEPQPRPHLQPNPLLRPPQPRPQAQVQSRPQPYSVAQPVAQPHPQPQPQLRPQPQLQPQALPRPQPQPQPRLPPQPTAQAQLQPRKQAQPQSVQQQQRPQLPPPLQPRLQPQPQPQLQPPRLPPQAPKPNPHLATDPTIPLKLCTLRQIPHLPYAQNWMINVLAIVVSNSDVQPSPMQPTYSQRIVRLADQSTSKHILLNVFLDAEDFNPKPGEVVLLMGVKNHRFEGGSLKKYWSDRPPEGATKWKWWVGEEALGGIGWCKGMVEELKTWWGEKEKEKANEEGGERVAG